MHTFSEHTSSYFFRSYPRTNGEENMAYNIEKISEAVIGRLESHPLATLRDLSQEFKVGERIIEKAVKANKGIAFRELRRELLLRKACDFLDQPNRSVKEVSFLLGFSSPKAFARFIKRASGRTATQLRHAIT